MVFDSGDDKPEGDEEKDLESNLDESLESDVGRNVAGNVEGVMDGDRTSENGTDIEQTEDPMADKKEILDFQLAEAFKSIGISLPAVYHSNKRDSFDDLFTKSKRRKSN